MPKRQTCALLLLSAWTDQRLLKDVAKSDKEWAVRKAAVNRMHDNVMLAEIAENDKDPNVSRLRWSVSPTQSVLAHLATASDYIDSENLLRYPRDVRKLQQHTSPTRGSSQASPSTTRRLTSFDGCSGPPDRRGCAG